MKPPTPSSKGEEVTNYLVEEITDWLMEDYVEGNIAKGIMRNWTTQLVERHYQSFLKEYENKRKSS